MGTADSDRMQREVHNDIIKAAGLMKGAMEADRFIYAITVLVDALLTKGY